MDTKKVLRNIMGDKYSKNKEWYVEFDGGHSVVFPAEEDEKYDSRNSAIKKAREILSKSSDFETRRASNGRIIKLYKR